MDMENDSPECEHDYWNTEDVKNMMSGNEILARPEVNRLGFYPLMHRRCEKLVDFVLCPNTKCGNVYKYKSRTSGTSHFKTHLRKCLSSSGQTNIVKTAPEQQSLPKQKTISANDKAHLKRKFAEMCALDLQPLSVISDSGFNQVCQTMINIGAKYGKMSVEMVIPSQECVSEEVDTVAREKRSEVNSRINNAIDQYGCFGVSATVWKDKANKSEGISLAIHDLNEDETECSSLIIHVSDANFEWRTAANINMLISNVFAEYEISNETLLKHAIFVSDNELNVDDVLEDNYEWMPCGGHMLNTCLTDLFSGEIKYDNSEEDRMDDDGGAVDIIAKAIIDVKNCVPYLKQSNLTAGLMEPVKNHDDNQWDSVATMLTTVTGLHDFIPNVLPEEKQDLYAAIDKEVLDNIVKLLELPKSISEQMDGGKPLTLHCIFPWVKMLELHFEVKKEDPHYIRKLKTNAAKILREKFKITTFHKMAYFLNPKMKRMKLLTKSEQNEVMKATKNRCKMFSLPIFPEVKIEVNEDNSIEDQEQETNTNMALDFSNFEDDNIDNEAPNSDVNEVNLYYNMTIQREYNSVLEFWVNTKSTLPTLSRVALGMLMIPASTAVSEPTFGNILSELRTSMETESVDNLVFLNSYLKTQL